MKKRVSIMWITIFVCILASASAALGQGETTIVLRRGAFDSGVAIDRGTKVNFKHAVRGTMNAYCKLGGETPFSATIGEGESASYTFQDAGDYQCGFNTQGKDTPLGTLRVKCTTAGDDKTVIVGFWLEGIDVRNAPFGVGNRIEFRNDSDRAIGLKALDGSFDTGLLKNRETYVYTAGKAGEFEITTYMDGLPGRKLKALKIECR